MVASTMPETIGARNLGYSSTDTEIMPWASIEQSRNRESAIYGCIKNRFSFLEKNTLAFSELGCASAVLPQEPMPTFLDQESMSAEKREVASLLTALLELLSRNPLAVVASQDSVLESIIETVVASFSAIQGVTHICADVSEPGVLRIWTVLRKEDEKIEDLIYEREMAVIKENRIQDIGFDFYTVTADMMEDMMGEEFTVVYSSDALYKNEYTKTFV